MAAVTASLEQSLQNCSLNQSGHRGAGVGGMGRSSSSDSPETLNDQDDMAQRPEEKKHEAGTQSSASSSDENSTFVELNSHVSLPYHWEQCLDLKSGELYYINWSTGEKAKEDPRTTATGYNGDYESEEEDENEEEEDDNTSPYDSEGSSTESSPCSSTGERFRSLKKAMPKQQQQELSQDSVLVVAGCTSCLMYYMLPKLVHLCPKCSGQLLHFAANDNSSP